MDLSDGEILERAKWVKAKCKKVAEGGNLEIRQLSKVVVLANQLGLGKRKLYRQNRKLIESENRAEDLQDMLGDLFPKVKQFKFDIRDVAHGLNDYEIRNTRLRKLADRFGGPKYLHLKEWGIIDYFFDVYSWRYSKTERGWQKQWGTDSEKAIAFPVQGEAFGMLKWEIRKMWVKGILEKYGFINTIHDSNVFLVADSHRDNCLVDVFDIMHSPCDRMVNQATGALGLTVGVEASIGKNLQDKDYFGEGTNPEGMRGVA
jgi:hypothetical protein